MKIVYSWLREFLPEAPSPERLEELLAGLGHEAENIQHLGLPDSKIVFARVLAVEAIEGAEVRRVVLDIGREVQVVSGAPNVRAGMGVVLALPGATLPNGTTLAARKMVGLESYGMALSPKELGVGEFGGGLMELHADSLPPGTPLAEAWLPESVFDLEITPNRPDVLSHYGLARDLAALGMTLVPPDPRPKGLDIPVPYKVWIEDTQGCDRFTLSYARGITIAPSPLAAQQRLYAAGMRPISNIVDATNYVMLELGNPMHAYDGGYIKDGLYVRRARPGESLTTLDGVERKVDGRDLLICVRDGSETRAAGLAGIMGGADDEIRETTTEVALEVAHFDPVSVRLTARRQGLKTEASYRFERGVDWDGQLVAARRFLELAQLWAGAEVSEHQLDLDHVRRPEPISFRPDYTNRLVGFETPVSAADQLEILRSLGCRTEEAPRRFKVHGKNQEEEAYLVTPPSHRIADLNIEEDLVEEVARVIGYDKLPNTLPAFFPAPDNIGVEAGYLAKERLKAVLEGLGFQEVVNYSWTSAEELAKYRAPAPTVDFQNPQASDKTHLRTALYPGLLHNLEVNQAQGEAGPFLFFEIGNIFHGSETTRVALMLCGESVTGRWQPGLGGGFYALKGLLEAAALQLGAQVKVEMEGFGHLHPGVSGAVLWNGQKIGSIGQVHPAVLAAAELPTAIVAELEFPLPDGQIPFKDIARFPASLRDVAVLVPERATYAEVENLIRGNAGGLLEELEIFDIYRGRPLEPGQKSLAFHLTFRHPERTLTDTETDGFMQAVIGAIEGAGYAIRK